MLRGMASISRNKRRSPVWEHFDLIAPTRVRCLLCSQELSHNASTSSMVRHIRAKHSDNQVREVVAAEVNPKNPDSSRKQMLDEALVDMLVKGRRPFSMVKGEGFRQLMRVLDPNYTIPSTKDLKALRDVRYGKPTGKDPAGETSSDSD